MNLKLVSVKTAAHATRDNCQVINRGALNDGISVILDPITFFQAVSTSNLDLLEFAILLGLRLSVTGDDRSSALNCDARAGQPTTVERLLHLIVPIETRNEKGRTLWYETVIG